MKIVHVILSKGFAGSERYVLDLINYQSKNNDCYLIKNSSNKSEQFINNLNKKITVFNIRNYFKSYQIEKLINQISPNIIHTHLGGASRLIKKSNKYKLIATSLMNFKIKYYKNHDGIIVLNRTQEKAVRKIFKGKVKKLFLWTKLKKNKPKKYNLRKDLEIPKESYVFGSLGRYHPQKGFDILIKAFIKANLNNCYLVLAGQNSSSFSKFKSTNIKILDHQNELDKFFNTLNCFVMPSRWEGFGLVLLEAMKFNLPIISSLTEGNEEWISNFPVSTFNINDSKNLVELLKNEFKIKIKKKNYNLNYFNYEKNCKEVEKFYLKV